MPPVRIYSDRPINPAKAEDAEPQTAPPPTNTSNQPSNNSASNTTANATGNHYIPPAPGAAPVPAPTGAVTSNVPQVHTTLRQPEPTRTTAYANDAPPPPQPGAVPLANAIAPVRSSPKSNIPPAPRAGDAPNPTSTSNSTAITPAPSTTSSMAREPPTQLSIPPPSQNAAPTHSTIAATTLSYGGQYGPDPSQTGGAPPAVVSAQNQGAPNISPNHPPGYVQNPYAADMMSASQRGANNTLGAASGVTGNAGSAEMDRSLWDTAKKWVGEAGKGLQQLEEEAWRRVNGK